ncbi:hypothetical protein V1511DRAFT_463500 [Dipodascopsis uninucleata]
MRPPWLPQNIQKRLLRYILSRVAIFDDLDLANLDVQLGSNSSVSLRNVRLNVDSISIPGMFLRDGLVSEIIVRVPSNILTSSIDVILNGVDVTIAPSSSGPSAEEFLSQTTANIASSFLHNESVDETIELEKSVLKPSSEHDGEYGSSSGLTADDSEEDDELLGFGTGGATLQSMMAKIVDMLLSQLQISVTGLSLRVVLPDLIMQGTVANSKFQTSEDGRIVVFNDIQFSLPPDLNKAYIPFFKRPTDGDSSSYYPSDTSTDSSTDGGISSSDAEEEQAFDIRHSRSQHRHQRNGTSKTLLESTYFSREEAGSIYMSAMTPSAQELHKSLHESQFGQMTSAISAPNEPTASAAASGSIPEGNGNNNVQLSDVPPRLMWCDFIEIKVKGPLAKSEIRVGTLKTGLAHLDAVSHAFSRLLDSFFVNQNSEVEISGTKGSNSTTSVPSANQAYHSEASEVTQAMAVDRNVKIGINRIELSPGSDLSASGEFVMSDKIKFILTDFFASVSRTLSVDAISSPYVSAMSPSVASILSIDTICAYKGNNMILEFLSNDGISQSIPDLTISAAHSLIKVQLPRDLNISASEGVLSDVFQFVYSIRSSFEIFTSIPSLSSRASPSPHSDSSLSGQHSTIAILGNTNNISITVKCDGDNINDALFTVKPISFKGNTFISPSATLSFAGLSVDFLNLKFELSPKTTFLERDANDSIIQRGVASKFSIASLKAQVRSIGELNTGVEKMIKQFESFIQLVSQSAKNQDVKHQTYAYTTLHRLANIVAIANSDVLISVDDEVGNIRLCMENAQVAGFDSDSIFVDIGDVRVIREATAISYDDDDGVEFELVGTVLEERRRNKPSISFIIRDRSNVSAVLYNLRLEYKIDLILLLSNAFSNRNDEGHMQKSGASDTVDERSDSPSWDYDMVEHDDGLRSGVDDEDYADEDFGIENHTEIEDSLATLKTAVAPFKFSATIRDCAIGLNPIKLSSKALLVITDGQADGFMSEGQKIINAGISIRRASMFLIDNVANLARQERQTKSVNSRRRIQVVEHMTPFGNLGYVNVASMSSASIKFKIYHEQNIKGEEGDLVIDMDIRDDLLFLETCADSTQTLIEVFNGLRPPIDLNSDEPKYQTEIVPVDLLSSLDEHAFRAKAREHKGASAKNNNWMGDGPLLPSVNASDSAEVDMESSNISSYDVERQILEATENKLEFVESYYGSPKNDLGVSQPLDAPYSSSNKIPVAIGTSNPNGNLSDVDISREEPDFASSPESEGQFDQQIQEAMDNIKIIEDHFGNNSLMDTVLLRGKSKVVTIKARDVHLLWNLHDGYDWPRTREAISKAVKRVEVRAAEAIRNRLQAGYTSDENESIIGDFLFNSIYIGVPPGNDARDLASAINNEIDDESETASLSSSFSGFSSRPASRAESRTFNGSPALKRNPKLHLKRSRSHKIQIELRGVNVNFIVYPESSMVANSTDLQVREFEIFDNVPTSTWRKFATYMQSAGERESGSSMAHIELLNVRPSPDLATTEIVLKVSVLPLRLYVDQDALDFLTRFFEFKNDTFVPELSEEIPFLQRVEFNTIQVKLDYKPKKVDFAGLRSGHTTEFMNFFVLDEAKIVLRGAVLYGILGYPRLFKMLNDIWLPDIRSTQLADVLAGVAPVKSLVKLGGGVKDLIVVPVREYQKDGRLVRSIQKGAMRFATVTTNELVNLGAKLAVGTQNVLENAESLLVGKSEPHSPGDSESSYHHMTDYSDSEEEESNTKMISMYADQPQNISQGLQRAYSSLNRNFGTAKDILISLPSEAGDQGGSQKAVIAIARAAPVAVLRSMIGATEAVSSTLMGVNNQIDPQRRRHIENKYKRR